MLENKIKDYRKNARITQDKLAAAVVSIILRFLNMESYANVLLYSLYGFIVIYLICYFIVAQKN